MPAKTPHGVIHFHLNFTKYKSRVLKHALNTVLEVNQISPSEHISKFTQHTSTVLHSTEDAKICLFLGPNAKSYLILIFLSNVQLFTCGMSPRLSPVTLFTSLFLVFLSFYLLIILSGKVNIFVSYLFIFYPPFFIGPESDHWECLSVTHSLTHSLTP